MKRWQGALGVVILAGCASSDAAPATTATTVAIAAPPTDRSALPVATTRAPSTTEAAAPPATSPPPTTTVAPTTTPPTAAEVAETEIAATLKALYEDLDRCWGAPDDCDVDSLVDTYFAATDDRASWIYKDVWEGLRNDGNIKILDGRVERTVAWITSDPQGTAGTSFVCQIDNSINVPKDTPRGANTTVPAEAQTGYLRYYFEWQRQPDNTWLISRSESAAGYTPEADRYGDLPSLTENEIDQCF